MKNTIVRRLHAARLSAVSAYFGAVRFFAWRYYFIQSEAAQSI